ncbi:hypothetical protein D9543_02745 [Corynebacterium macginleyi]|uniref:Uncharacterized protein n=1 Tax=Corynebacterium macginleyi TaxID=38290 RepID=A0A3M0H0G3_9CORY|nr:hypothetical protein D9543_02745 [Corynebacterium macginleyi]RMB67119.1 hypothetical protein D9V82_04285 [Corynebacterium macginleyi]
MFFLVILAMTCLYGLHPLFWDTQPKTWEAYFQGFFIALIVASLVTARGRESLRRIARVIEGKPRDGESHLF